MSINGVSSQSFYERTTGQKSASKESGNDFYKSLSETIDEKSEDGKTEDSTNSSGSLQTKWDEAMLQYNGFVKDRIKNGPQKFQIGGTEFSLEQWDKLIEKVDVNLEGIKEDLAERIEDKKKAEAEKKLEADKEVETTKNSESIYLSKTITLYFLSRYNTKFFPRNPLPPIRYIVFIPLYIFLSVSSKDYIHRPPYIFYTNLQLKQYIDQDPSEAPILT